MPTKEALLQTMMETGTPFRDGLQVGNHYEDGDYRDLLEHVIAIKLAVARSSISAPILIYAC